MLLPKAQFYQGLHLRSHLPQMLPVAPTLCKGIPCRLVGTLLVLRELKSVVQSLGYTDILPGGKPWDLQML